MRGRSSIDSPPRESTRTRVRARRLKDRSSPEFRRGVKGGYESDFGTALLEGEDQS